MTRHSLLLLGACALIVTSLLGVACSSARADRVAPASLAEPAPAPPYSLEILDEMGLPAETYYRAGRTYLLGHRGQRYTVRITNPTPRRVEAVATSSWACSRAELESGEPLSIRDSSVIRESWSSTIAALTV